MGKRLLFTLFAILFCSTTFGQNYHWTATGNGDYSDYFSINAVIQFDGVEWPTEEPTSQLELAAFYEDECRAATMTQYISINQRYMARLRVYGNVGQVFTLKLYDHGSGKTYTDNYVIRYEDGVINDLEIPFVADERYGTISSPATINFKTPNYYTPNTDGDNENISITAVVLIDGVEQYDSNLELGAFCGNVVKGSAKTNFVDTNNGVTRNYARTTVSGKSNDVITFRLYNHSTGKELEFTEVNTINFVANTSVGTILQPLEVNFITASYVAQIGENKYTTFEKAYEAAQDNDDIILLDDITLESTPTVISKDINITLGEYAITGTVELANVGATITGAQNGVTSVTTNVEGYKVVYEDGKYKLVEKLSGEIAYRAYVGDESNRESVKVDLKNIYASESVVVKLYDANNNLLTTTSYKAGGVEAEYLTCNIVLWGNPSSSWETDFNVEKLTVDNYPKKAELLIDGTCIHTFDNILGNATDAAAYQLPAYLALDCVYKEASITRNGTTEYYMTLEAAIAAAQSGDEVVLHNDVLVSGKQTITTAITINGNDHFIKADENAVWYTIGNPPLNLKQYKTHLLGLNSDNITLKNIVLDCNNNAAGINLYCAQNVTFDNVEIINATKGVAALTVNGSTLTVKTNFVALGNLVAIDIDLGSGVTSALGFDVEDNTVFDLGGKQVQYDPAATIDMDGAVDTNGNPYFAAKDNVYYYTVAQMESRTTAYSNGLTLLTDVAINSDIRFSGNTLDLNEKTLSISAEKQMEVSGEFKITNGGAINGKIVLTTQETTITTTLNELNVIKKEGLDGEVVYVEDQYKLAPYVAKINDVNYISLQAAYEAVQPTGVIVLLQNITLTETLTIAAEKNFTLDLNGKTINVGYQENSTDKHIYAFDNKGTLILTNGTINARGIFNYGTLTVNADATVNSIDANGGYGVDNKGTLNVYGTIATTTEDGDAPGTGTDATPINNEANATVNVYEGSVINNVSNFTSALRNSGTANIEGGTFTSVHTTVINYGTMTIEGGSFTCNGLEGITAHAIWAAAGTTTINGGTFDGKDNYNGFNVDASEGATVYITGGNFLQVHSGSLYGDGTIAVSGGKFFDPVPEGRCAAGYIPTANTDGTYGVKQGSYVAQVGEVKYETLQAALEAAKASSENDAVTILKTIVLSETQTIDFENIAVTSTVNPAFRITSGAAVTVKNGNMNTKDGGYNFILGASDDASSYGNLTISSGKYHGATTVASVTRGALTITGGEFSVEPYQGNYAFLINCIDANYKNGTASVAIIGGTFHNWNPQNNAAEGAGTDFCHVDYAATETAENVWTVLPAVAKIGEARFATLQDAVDAAQANETINLIAYVELTTYVTIDKSVNLNLGQFNITRENGTALYVNGENVEVTIDGEGTVSGLQAVYVDNGTVTINGGNYVGGYEAVYVINNGHAVINGGTFGAENDEDDTDFVLNEYDETRNVTTITVYGGTFHGFNPQNNAAEGAGTNFCAEGYGTVESSTGVWEVVPMQGMKLYAGWNWFSSYVDINGEAGWENLKTGLGSNAMLVKNQNSMSQYYNTDNIVGWDGTLEETSVKEMYMIRMSADHDLTLTGKLVDPSENPITLHHNGWTWIGYPMNQGLALEDVLKGFNPNAGDRIKSHQGFSQYYDNELYEGWWGTLETMTPGYGYMYYNAGENNATLKYSYPADGSKSELRTNITSENNYWVPASSQYAGNMNIVAMFEADGDNYEIAAFVGGEVRGSARPIYVEPLDAYMFFLTVHGEDVEEMTFKVYDLATGEEYNLNDRMNYTDNAIVGSITEPYIFRGTVGVGETSLSEVNVYPNPTTIGNEINLGTECDTVEVFNALGVKVAEYQNVDTVDALETAGVYVIRITNDGNVQNCRLIVK